MDSGRKTTRILVLDDNAIDRESCRRLLGRNGGEYEVTEHNALEGALEMVEKIQPDCILLDYHLHDGNGLEFLGQLVAIGGPRTYPVVMLTGTGNESIAVDVMKAGAQDYLVKARLNAEILQRTIQTAIFKARTARLLDEQRSEMERLFSEAQEANARKDQFLAALSHELRTPLTPVLAALNSLNPETATKEDIRMFFAVIRRNIELEARLIDDMLDLTRIARGRLDVHPRSVDLHSLLHHAAQACEDERKSRQITIDWDLQAAENFAQADPARIQQVFWNLLKNALKFTPPGGNVRVTTRNVESAIEIAVTDTGIGIEKDSAERIFNAFEQGRSEISRRFGGLGLGLAISKALVDAHGGTISAGDNPDGPGAQFVVQLPADAFTPEESDDAVPPESGKESQDNSFSILLVEDHEDSAFFIKRMLEGEGYRTLVADTVAAALDAFQNHHVDVVVSDLGLPDGSGTDLMRRMQEIRPVPAVALSGYGMESDVQRSLQAGFSNHLTKPVDLDKLTVTVRELLSERD